MYYETLNILMEGLNNPIKEQIIKNQLTYHFKNKTPDNKYAIDNSVVIVRRLLEDFNVIDLITVQPIAARNNKCATIANDDNDEIDTFKTNVFFHEIQSLQPEINQAVASELDFAITEKIIETIKMLAPDYDVNNEIVIDPNQKFFPQKFVDDFMEVCDEVDADWMVIGLCELTVLRLHDDFISGQCNTARYSGGIDFVGTINHIKVYTALNITDTILIGSNDDENPPVIYAPETMLVIGNNVDDVNGERNELLSSGEIFTDLSAINDLYRKSSVRFIK